jgi:hypothetical protein
MSGPSQRDRMCARPKSPCDAVLPQQTERRREMAAPHFRGVIDSIASLRCLATICR